MNFFCGEVEIGRLVEALARNERGDRFKVRLQTCLEEFSPLLEDMVGATYLIIQKKNFFFYLLRFLLQLSYIF